MVTREQHSDEALRPHVPQARLAPVARSGAGWAAHPPAWALSGLLSVLANAPEPDKLPVCLMREVAAQLGADCAYLLCSDAASGMLTLSPWVVSHNAIQHCNTVPALVALRHGIALPPPETPRIERYALQQTYHPYLRPAAVTYFHQAGYRVGLSLPLQAGGKTIGFLECMARFPAAFQTSQLGIARALAEQLSVVVQCSRLIESAARTAAEEERQRLAREIHDTLGQTFTAILLQLRSAETLLETAPSRVHSAIQQVRSLAHGGLENARRTVDALRPQSLDLDLGAALRRAVIQATLGMPIDARCIVHGDVCALPYDTAVQLLRIAQEALSNTLKYAEARQITVVLVCEAEQTLLRVEDDGRGFDAARATAAGGFGLLSMRARAAAIGAGFALQSAPGQGTHLRVALPHLTEKEYGR